MTSVCQHTGSLPLMCVAFRYRVLRICGTPRPHNIVYFVARKDSIQLLLLHV